jgi:site-specific recombinase XerD
VDPTGARADEAAHVQISDLQLGLIPERDLSAVLIRGKGNKQRRCPLWAKTVNRLTPLVSNHPGRETPASCPAGRRSLNRRGQPLTRFGIHALVERYAERVATQLQSVAKKRVSPHTIRYTTATHLLRSGVDINTIRAWLGHASLSTANICAEVDVEMKAKALANCEIKEDEPKKPWREDKGLMEFLRTL